jgi:hypothetical protein
MICENCADAADLRVEHKHCAGSGWCDCQHERSKGTIPDEKIDKLVEEAKRGYDLKDLKPRHALHEPAAQGERKWPVSDAE